MMAAKEKTLGSSERDEQERAAFRREAAGVNPSLFVWVDECGTHIRLYARAPRGERAYYSVPRNPTKITTLIASIG
jgi:hypothetical protein